MLLRRLLLLLALCSAVLAKGDNPKASSLPTTKPSVLSRIKSKVIKHRDRFREWLKWDADCKFLTVEERVARVAEGRCPPLMTTTTKEPATTKKPSFWKRMRNKKTKKSSKINFIERKKQKLLSTFNTGKQNKVSIDLSSSHSTYNVLAGSMIIVTCDETITHDNGTSVVDWFVNTNKIEAMLLDWRVSVSEDNKLMIWPLIEEDEGHFECTTGGLHHASGFINVMSRQEALVNGFVNYLIVFAFYIPLAMFALFILGKSAINPPKVKERGDRMAEFLEQQILENRTAVKENVARIVHGEDFERRKAAVEESLRSVVGGQRSNRDTIMTVLAPPEEPPTTIRTRKRERKSQE